MAKTTFLGALGATIASEELIPKGDLNYLSAGRAVQLAGRPLVTFVEFDGKPHLECLGGALVAVDLVSSLNQIQRTWLPVMDAGNSALSLKAMKATDVNNARQRCLVKALACVTGVGMSVFLNCDGDGAKAVALLGLSETTDLATAPPVVTSMESGVPYLGWNVAVTACRIADEKFNWSVVDWNGLPYREVLGSAMVDVDTCFKGKTQRLSLPLMDGAFNPIPMAKATVFDWNKAVMRCLAKCIAFNSGYGLEIYTGDELGLTTEKTAKARSPKSETALKTGATALLDSMAKSPAVTPEPTKKTASGAPVAPVVAVSAPAAVVDDFAHRFSGVMQKRRNEAGVRGLISLFDAISASAKFTTEQKPLCFQMLVGAVSSVVDKESVRELLDALAKHSALQYVPADNMRLVAIKLTFVALMAGLGQPVETLQALVAALIRAGLAKDSAEVISLAEEANATAETLDVLKGLLAPATA